MNLVETPLMHTLSRALDLTSQRQSLVSQNVATSTPRAIRPVTSISGRSCSAPSARTRDRRQRR